MVIISQRKTNYGQGILITSHHHQVSSGIAAGCRKLSGMCYTRPGVVAPALSSENGRYRKYDVFSGLNRVVYRHAKRLEESTQHSVLYIKDLVIVGRKNTLK